MLVALILLSAIPTVLPSLSLGKSDAVVQSKPVVVSYTSTSLTTYYGSTNGTIVTQEPAGIQPIGFGFITPKGKCSQFSYPVIVTAGTKLNVQMSANNAVSFYLLPGYAFQLSPNGCTLTGDTILSESNFTAYTLHWTAPSNGTFYLIFTGPNAVVLLMDNGSTRPVSQVGSVTVATSTETSDLLYSTTSTEMHTTTLVEAFYLEPTNGYALLVGAIILLGVLLFLIIRKRQSSAEEQ
jgi:hypothetical protein